MPDKKNCLIGLIKWCDNLLEECKVRKIKGIYIFFYLKVFSLKKWTQDLCRLDRSFRRRCDDPVRTDSTQAEEFSYFLDIFFSLIEQGTIEVISLEFLGFDSLSMTYEYECASFHN